MNHSTIALFTTALLIVATSLASDLKVFSTTLKEVPASLSGRLRMME